MKLDCKVVPFLITCFWPMIRGSSILFVTGVAITLHKRMPLPSDIELPHMKSGEEVIGTPFLMSEWLCAFAEAGMHH